jgi:hypothetical protein
MADIDKGSKRFSISLYLSVLFRWRWKVIIGTVGTVILLGLSLPQLLFTSDYRVYFGPDNPQLKAFNAFERICKAPILCAISFEPKKEI